VSAPLTRLLDTRPARPLTRPQAPAALRTLIIEDNIDLAATYRTLLERRGHHVTVAYSGGDGLTAAHQQRFDLVLRSWLPDITGYEVARRLRADPGSRPGRLVAHSGTVRMSAASSRYRLGSTRTSSSP
jgi:CheY-like chemotaxis protein